MSPPTAGRASRETRSAPAVEARYLFGAPMGRAAVRWSLRQESLLYGGVEIPGTEGFYIGDGGWWYEELAETRAAVQVPASGLDTLDAGRTARPAAAAGRDRARPAVARDGRGHRHRREPADGLRLCLDRGASGRLLSRRQAGGRGWFWSAGQAGERRRHRRASRRRAGERRDGRGRHRAPRVAPGARERAGYAELVGEWVSDTVARVRRHHARPIRGPAGFTPPAGGSYIATFRAEDAAGRAVQHQHLPLGGRQRLGAVERREPVQDGRGARSHPLRGGRHRHDSLRLALHRRGGLDHAGARRADRAAPPADRERDDDALGSRSPRRSRPTCSSPSWWLADEARRPGPLDDPGRPTVRVGYAELRVTPERKRLAVQVQPLAAEYRPGDTARVAVEVRDAAGAGQRSEVTLWAVDEGVLALTGYRTPDPLDLLYRPRGLGMRLASTLTTVTPQVPEGEKGKRAPGGGGGADAADILRSRFQTTAFFLGSLVTNARRQRRRLGPPARQSHHLPGDGGRGHRRRPLRQRPVVPAGDPSAGGAPGAAALPPRRRSLRRRRRRQPPRRRTPKATVEARATGAKLEGRRKRDVTLEPGRGREVRFDFLAGAGRQPGAGGVPLHRQVRPRCRRRGAHAAGPAGAPPAVVHRGRRAPRLGHRRADAAGRRGPGALDPPPQSRDLAAGDDPRRARAVPGLSRTGAPSRSPAPPSRSSRSTGRAPELGADSAVARRARARSRAGGRDPGPPPAARRRHRPLERRRLDHAVAQRLRRRRAARRQGRRPRGGRLGARPARRLSPALARGAGADHWRRSPPGTTATRCGSATG